MAIVHVRGRVGRGMAACVALFLVGGLAVTEADPYRTVSPVAFTSPNDIAGGGSGEVSVVGTLGGGSYPLNATVNIKVTNLSSRTLLDTIFVPQFVWQGTSQQVGQTYEVAVPLGLYTDGGQTGMAWAMTSTEPDSFFRMYGTSGVSGVDGAALVAGSTPSSANSDWDDVAGSFGFGPTANQTLDGSKTYAGFYIGTLAPGDWKTISVGVKSTGAFLGGNLGAWEGDVYEVIPEPGTVGMFLLGATGLLMAVRRRR